MIGDFKLAVMAGRMADAVRLGNEILTHMPPQPIAEPAAKSAETRNGPFSEGARGGFEGIECGYWTQALTVKTGPAPTFSGGMHAFQSAARAVLREAMATGRAKTPLAIAEHFRLAGWMAAAVIPQPGTWPGIVEVRWSEWVALIALPDQIVPRVSAGALLNADDYPGLEGVSDVCAQRVTLKVPVRVADLWTRNQILGDLLRQGKSTGKPVLGESPTLYFQLYKALSGQQNDDAEWQVDYR
jgi:hypothetical protein